VARHFIEQFREVAWNPPAVKFGALIHPFSTNDFAVAENLNLRVQKRPDVAQAASASRQAVALDERRRPTRKTLIQLLLAQGRLKEAKEQAGTFARLHHEERDRVVLAKRAGQISKRAIG
jgi:hypothetical protein